MSEFTTVRIQEIRKCVKDISYFADNYYTSATLSGIGMFPLYKGQKRMLKGMARNRNIVNMGARQTGLTTLNSIYALWEASFFSDSTIVIVSTKVRSAQEILERIKLAYDKMPNWLKPDVRTYNKTEIGFTNDSSIRVIACSSSACCGMCPSTLIIDNAAFLKNIEEFWNSVYPVMSASRHSKIILSSTPNGTDNLFADIYSKAKKSKYDWHYDRLKWQEVPGRGKAWKTNMIKCMGADAFKREFSCEFI